jgi:hypothetical protein
MKKIFIIVVFLFVTLTSYVLSEANNYFSIGPAYSTVSQNQLQVYPSYKETYVGYGINMTAFSGKSIGLYSAVTLFLIQEFTAESGSDSITFDDLSAFDSAWGMDSQFGIGQKRTIGTNGFILAGGGINYSQIVTTCTDIYGYQDGFIFGVIGAGGLIEIGSELSDGFSIVGAIRGGYNFSAIMGDLTEHGIDYGGGFAFSAAIGFGVGY